ncbi:MAG: hypothetical protein ABII01_00265 [Candidatus Woesearchaeota archaeon]
MQECQEPKCRYPATRDWHGRKVCDDHYEQYKAKERELQNNDYGG